MASQPRNVLIANGRELIGPLSWPKGGGDKAHPYTIGEIRLALHPELTAIQALANQPLPGTAPRGEITAKVVLHPAYLAKSYFPAGLLREVGLSILGSRPTRVRPRTVRKSDRDQALETAAIFVSGTAASFGAMDRVLMDDAAPKGRQEQLVRIEHITVFDDAEKLRLDPRTPWRDHVHVTLHASEGDADIRASFQAYVQSLGGQITSRGYRFVPGLTFVTVRLPADQVSMLARFQRIRLVRSMPQLQGDWVLEGSLRKSFKPLAVPVGAAPLMPMHTAAIFDGGTVNALHPWVNELASASLPAPSAGDVAHGINVTSAFLFGAVSPGMAQLPIPYCRVDHHRVLPTLQSPEQALDVLDRIVTALRSARTAGRPYRFSNISLGPVATFFDDDVHEWTSRLDTELADGQTLCTAAVGNNGLHAGDLGRIQPPGDAVNVFAIGAAGSAGKRWGRAPYSAWGPGRSPGFVKPDALAFGGSNEEPVAIFNPLAGVVAVAGTSFASPLALRVAVGVDVLSQSSFDPITLQALLVNACEFSARRHDRREVGWGRLPLDPEDILYTPADVVRIVYQGVTRPGHPQKALIPIPHGLPPATKVRLGATFCYRAPVDSAHAINYTRAGLWVRCYKRPGKSLPLFGSGMYKTESELRRDAMRWDTVLHNSRKIAVEDLAEPYFHINYQVRDESEAVRMEDAVPMPYALVVTIQAPGVSDLLARIQTQFPVLQTLPAPVQAQVPVAAS